MLIASMNAFASTTKTEKLLGTFGSWRSYTYNEGGQTVCYMVTTKRLKSVGPLKRATPYLMITHRPIEASTDVISYGAGTLLKSSRGVKLHVGKSIFDLFSVRDTSWARDALTDHKIATALRNSPLAEISATADKKGEHRIVDKFDLTGGPAAYSAIGRACGLSAAPTKKSGPKPTANKKPKRS